MMGFLIKRKRKQIKVVHIIKTYSFDCFVNYLVIDNKHDQTRIGFQIGDGILRKRMTNKFLLSIQPFGVDCLDYTCPIMDAVPYHYRCYCYCYCSYEIK